jgi:hypothetical protein
MSAFRFHPAGPRKIPPERSFLAGPQFFADDDASGRIQPIAAAAPGKGAAAVIQAPVEGIEIFFVDLLSPASSKE